MQVILGMDADAGKDMLAASLLQRLAFTPQPCVDLVHVVPPPAYAAYDMEPVLSAMAIAELVQSEREAAAERVQTAVRNIGSEAMGTSEAFVCRPVVREGPVTSKLVEYARGVSADLIAVNGSHHGGLGAILSGSVARGLVLEAPCSLLIAKPAGKTGSDQPTGQKPVRAVIATDHSKYANDCLERLIRFRPRGIVYVTVMAAYPQEQLHGLVGVLHGLAVDPADTVRCELARRNGALLGRLRTALEPLSCDSRVAAGPVHEAIVQAMDDTRADLLILGARGHDFLERLTMGSVSYREAMTNQRSILILRA